MHCKNEGLVEMPDNVMACPSMLPSTLSCRCRLSSAAVGIDATGLGLGMTTDFLGFLHGHIPNCHCGVIPFSVDPHLPNLLALWQQVYSDHDFPRVRVPDIEIFIAPHPPFSGERPWFDYELQRWAHDGWVDPFETVVLTQTTVQGYFFHSPLLSICCTLVNCSPFLNHSPYLHIKLVEIPCWFRDL